MAGQKCSCDEKHHIVACQPLHQGDGEQMLAQWNCLSCGSGWAEAVTPPEFTQTLAEKTAAKAAELAEAEDAAYEASATPEELASKPKAKRQK